MLHKSYFSRVFRMPFNPVKKNLLSRGGSPGVVVIGGDSCPEGCGFKSQHRITGWIFYSYICCKIKMFVGKDENKQKEAGDGT